MKIKISEDKLEQAIFLYLDNKLTFKDTPNGIFFSEKNNKNVLLIKVRGERSKVCHIYIELLNEIETFFSIEYPDSIDIVSEYIEKTLGIKLSRTVPTWAKWKLD